MTLRTTGIKARCPICGCSVYIDKRTLADARDGEPYHATHLPTFAGYPVLMCRIDAMDAVNVQEVVGGEIDPDTFREAVKRASRELALGKKTNLRLVFSNTEPVSLLAKHYLNIVEEARA